MNDDSFYTQLLTRVLTGEASPKEQQQLQEWANRHPNNQRFIEETRQVWEWSIQHEKRPAVDTAGAWQRLQQHLPPHHLPAHKGTWAAVAIGFVVLIGVGIWWLQPATLPLPPPQPPIMLEEQQPIFASFETGANKRRLVVLPDGSKATLNANSSLRYDERFKPRRVELEGEAYFDVVPNVAQPFSIETGRVRTVVLGTTFSVRAYKGKATEVAVFTGKVSVQNKQPSAANRVVLPGEVAIHRKNDGQINITKQTSSNALAWRNRELIFENQPLHAVVEDLERYFGVTIKGDQKLFNCRYTGTFKQPKLNEVLETIAFAFPSGIDFQSSEDQLVYELTGKGCE